MLKRVKQFFSNLLIPTESIRIEPNLDGDPEYDRLAEKNEPTVDKTVEVEAVSTTDTTRNYYQEVGKTFAGNAAFLKSRNNKPDKEYKNGMSTALAKVLRFDEKDQGGRFHVRITVLTAKGTSQTYVRKISIKNYFDKITRGFLTDIPVHQYGPIRKEMRYPKRSKKEQHQDRVDQFLKKKDEAFLQEFKTNYAAHRAQQPNNLNVGVVVKLKENGDVKEQEFRGVEKIDDLIKRAEAGQVTLLKMVR
jgi:hypothetical protein